MAWCVLVHVCQRIWTVSCVSVVAARDTVQYLATDRGRVS